MKSISGTLKALSAALLCLFAVQVAASGVRAEDGGFKRYCKICDLKSDPELVAEYRRLLANEFPSELAGAMKDAGVLDMEIYLCIGRNRLLMIMETGLDFDLEKVEAKLAALSEHKKWAALTAKRLQPLPQAGPDGPWVLTERGYKLDQKKEFEAEDGYVERKPAAATRRICEARQLVDDPVQIA